MVVALLLRRILHMDATNTAQRGGLPSLRGHLPAIYTPLAQEIEAHTAILGITLNEAFNERGAGRREMAWHIVQLAMGEWERLAELLVGLQSVLNKFLPGTTGIVPVRRVAAGHFKSRAVMDNVGLYEFLYQPLFSSKHRFAIQRPSWSSIGLLTKEFRRACREGESTLDCGDELWTRLDCYFHDFDLIAKEMLLAFRTFLTCQSPEAAEESAVDLHTLLERGKRVSVSLSDC